MGAIFKGDFQTVESNPAAVIVDDTLINQIGQDIGISRVLKTGEILIHYLETSIRKRRRKTGKKVRKKEKYRQAGDICPENATTICFQSMIPAPRSPN